MITFLRFQLFGGEGVAAVSAVDEVEVFALAGVVQVAGEQALIRGLDPVEDVALLEVLLESIFELLAFLFRAVDHHVQGIVDAEEVVLMGLLLKISLVVKRLVGPP